MTKRDSLLAGFTSPSSSMSMPRRHPRSYGYPIAALLHLRIPTILLAVPLISLIPLPGLLFQVPTPVANPLTAGTQLRLRQYPFLLLPIIRLRSLLHEKKRIHSRWRLKKNVANSMPIFSQRFAHLRLIDPSHSSVASW